MALGGLISLVRATNNNIRYYKLKQKFRSVEIKIMEYCQVPVLLAVNHGALKLGSSYAMLRMVQGVALFTAPPIAGLSLHDQRHVLPL